MLSKKNHIEEIVSTLPHSSGVYQYFNSDGEIIYVGKAKDLKKRVSSYFNKTDKSVKVQALVKHIADLKYIVVNTENDALLLENNLIKQYQPRYNILLKDGKTYPWICITKEDFPRIFKTRIIMRGAEYFGPYSSVWILDTILDLVKQIYPIRTCRFPMNEETIKQGKHKECLEYHIKNCMAPCVGFQTKEEYQKIVGEIREIIKGNSKFIANKILEEINKCAEELRFEEAEELKQKYLAIINFQNKTVVTTATDENLDVMAYDVDEKSVYINMLQIVNGSIVKGLTIEYQKRIDEADEEILALGLLELRSRLQSDSKVILVPFMPDIELEGISLKVPMKGDKKKLIDLSMQNVKQYKLDKLKRNEELNIEQKTTQILFTLKEKLGLNKLPIHIECFDNSNISGTDAVAACVVFKKGKPSKKDYRKYNIKSVVGPDDYASMREVVYRRYSRLVEEGEPLPDLIIADGGVGHIETIRKVVEEELNLNIPIAGLAKNDKHRTRDLIFNNQVISMKTNDVCFNFLTQIQNEVHRFAIEFHRDKRSKSQLKSELDEITGIGPNTKEKLLKELKSVKRIQNAEISELEKIIGTHRASIVYEYFHKN
ncbi:MAG: excinuclease ABC subunit C [Paludibacteraceae bacterium]|nr:excinuclease ABC subunit C [Paludibacteraceae bacterium]